jgi:hypothetical protein
MIGQQYEIICIFVTNPNPGEILEFPIFLLANDCHFAYSTLYLRTIVNWPSGRLPGRFSAYPQVRLFTESPYCVENFEWHFDGSVHMEGV